MEKIPKVGIIVLNYNGRDVLQKCLGSLSVCDYEKFEVIVVDNNSGDSSFEKAQENFPEFDFLKNDENLGFSKGNNVGIRHALQINCDYVVLLNNDTTVDKNFLNKLIEIGEKFPTIGLLCPVILKGESEQIWFSGGEIDWLRMKTSHKTDTFEENFRQSSFITGCAVLIKKEVFEKIGLLDEDYFLYWEDADFCFKSRQAGFDAVVCSKSKIRHWEISENMSENKLYWLVFSGLLFFKKNSPWHLRPWINMYLIIRKAKNLLDRLKDDNTSAAIVHKAYKDFKDAKKTTFGDCC